MNLFDQIVSLGGGGGGGGAARSSVLPLCVILGCCYNYYELCLFLCVFSVSTAAVYLCV